MKKRVYGLLFIGLFIIRRLVLKTAFKRQISLLGRAK